MSSGNPFDITREIVEFKISNPHMKSREVKTKPMSQVIQLVKFRPVFKNKEENLTMMNIMVGKIDCK